MSKSNKIKHKNKQVLAIKKDIMQNSQFMVCVKQYHLARISKRFRFR